MNYKYQFFLKLIFISFLFVLSFILGCTSENDSEKIKRIALEDFEAKLPDKKGVELVQTNCMICHSVEYINMQPQLTEKAWEKTVDKMIKNFGAPVADSTTRAEIIRYLVSVKGK